MSLRSRFVGWCDANAATFIGNARYHYHVTLRRDIVYPQVSKELFRRINARQASAMDVGANVGIFTRYLCGQFASVIAVEPIPYLADRLNRSKPSNCSVHAVALGEAAGSVTMRVPVNATGSEMPALSTASQSNTLSFIDCVDVVEKIVECRLIDDVAGGMKNLGFVKIDVEGFEGSVLAGASHLLSTIRPVIQLEIGRAHNPEYQKVLAKMAEAGFTIFALQKEGIYRDAERFLDQQPLAVSNENASSPEGCWDYLFLPNERADQLSSGLIRD
jgi:FkbM family methyltransferase